jgi:hypothetical protein
MPPPSVKVARSIIGDPPSGITVISHEPSNDDAVEPPPLAFDRVLVKAMRVASIAAITRVASVFLIVISFSPLSLSAVE